VAGDFLHDLITAAAAAGMESPSAVLRFEVEFREKHGGTRRYIARTPHGRQSKTNRVGSRYFTGIEP
jgi:hypothetical protein